MKKIKTTNILFAAGLGLALSACGLPPPELNNHMSEEGTVLDSIEYESEMGLTQNDGKELDKNPGAGDNTISPEDAEGKGTIDSNKKFPKEQCKSNVLRQDDGCAVTWSSHLISDSR